MIKYSFDETRNEYVIEKFSLENEDNDFQELILLKNNTIFIMTIKYIYFYSYNKENKTLKLVKKFNNIFGEKLHPKDVLHIIYLKDGKILFYYISGVFLIISNQQIQLIGKFTGKGYFNRINDKLLKYEDYSDAKKTYFDIYKTKFFKKEGKFDEFNIDGHFLNNNIIIKSGINTIEIKDIKTKEIEYINIGILEIFIFNKKENLFGLFIYDDKKYKLLILKKK